MKFDIPEHMVAVIGRSLGRMPHDEVRTIIDELQRQINAQQAQRVEAAEPPKE